MSGVVGLRRAWSLLTIVPSSRTQEGSAVLGDQLLRPGAPLRVPLPPGPAAGRPFLPCSLGGPSGDHCPQPGLRSSPKTPRGREAPAVGKFWVLILLGTPGAAPTPGHPPSGPSVAVLWNGTGSGTAPLAALVRSLHVLLESPGTAGPVSPLKPAGDSSPRPSRAQDSILLACARRTSSWGDRPGPLLCQAGGTDPGHGPATADTATEPRSPDLGPLSAPRQLLLFDGEFISPQRKPTLTSRVQALDPVTSPLPSHPHRPVHAEQRAGAVLLLLFISEFFYHSQAVLLDSCALFSTKLHLKRLLKLRILTYKKFLKNIKVGGRLGGVVNTHVQITGSRVTAGGEG